jgi:predicted MFS family arabinose efflux permease
VTEPRYLLAFLATSLLTTGGFMLMPFSSAFVVNNLAISFHDLPTVYLVTGICTIFVGPLVGKAADKVGKFNVFAVGTVVSIVMVLVYTNLQAIPLVGLIVVNVLLFSGIFSRMIPFQAMMAGVPSAVQRGSFSAISASIQQLSGGIASVIAGHVVSIGVDGKLQNFNILGYVIVGTSVVAFSLLWRLNRNTLREAALKVAVPV